MEDICMDNYEVIKKFDCYGKSMVIVRIGNAAHVMSAEEWHKVHDMNHKDKLKIKKVSQIGFIGGYMEQIIDIVME